MTIHAPEIFYQFINVDSEILPNFFTSFDLETNYE